MKWNKDEKLLQDGKQYLVCYKFLANKKPYYKLVIYFYKYHNSDNGTGFYEFNLSTGFEKVLDVKDVSYWCKIEEPNFDNKK